MYCQCLNLDVHVVVYIPSVPGVLPWNFHVPLVELQLAHDLQCTGYISTTSKGLKQQEYSVLEIPKIIEVPIESTLKMKVFLLLLKL